MITVAIGSSTDSHDSLAGFIYVQEGSTVFDGSAIVTTFPAKTILGYELDNATFMTEEKYDSVL